MQAAGLPDVGLHGLRHTHATMLLEAGVPLKVVSERLGHSSISITADTYQHVLDHMQDKAAEAIRGLIPRLDRAGSGAASDGQGCRRRRAGRHLWPCVDLAPSGDPPVWAGLRYVTSDDVALHFRRLSVRRTHFHEIARRASDFLLVH